MPHICRLCNSNVNLFFVWTSSRGFPIDKLISNNSSKEEINELNNGFEVCFKCRNKLEVKD